jgi:phage terminase large subunit-like protein
MGARAGRGRDGRGDPGRARRVALVGETLDQVREVMVLGESGILACSPPDRRAEVDRQPQHPGMAEWRGGAAVFGA